MVFFEEIGVIQFCSNRHSNNLITFQIVWFRSSSATGTNLQVYFSFDHIDIVAIEDLPSCSMFNLVMSLVLNATYPMQSNVISDHWVII